MVLRATATEDHGFAETAFAGDSAHGKDGP